MSEHVVPETAPEKVYVATVMGQVAVNRVLVPRTGQRIPVLFLFTTQERTQMFYMSMPRRMRKPVSFDVLSDRAIFLAAMSNASGPVYGTSACIDAVFGAEEPVFYDVPTLASWLLPGSQNVGKDHN